MESIQYLVTTLRSPQWREKMRPTYIGEATGQDQSLADYWAMGARAAVYLSRVSMQAQEASWRRRPLSKTVSFEGNLGRRR